MKILVGQSRNNPDPKLIVPFVKIFISFLYAQGNLGLAAINPFRYVVITADKS